MLRLPAKAAIRDRQPANSAAHRQNATCATGRSWRERPRPIMPRADGPPTATVVIPPSRGNRPRLRTISSPSSADTPASTVPNAIPAAHSAPFRPPAIHVTRPTTSGPPIMRLWPSLTRASSATARRAGCRLHISIHHSLSREDMPRLTAHGVTPTVQSGQSPPTATPVMRTTINRRPTMRLGPSLIPVNNVIARQHGCRRHLSIHRSLSRGGMRGLPAHAVTPAARSARSPQPATPVTRPTTNRPRITRRLPFRTPVNSATQPRHGCRRPSDMHSSLAARTTSPAHSVTPATARAVSTAWLVTPEARLMDTTGTLAGIPMTHKRAIDVIPVGRETVHARMIRVSISTEAP